MLVSSSLKRRPSTVESHIADAIEQVSAERLMSYVEAIAYPRHYESEHEANCQARDWLVAQLKEFGYEPTFQGEFDNIVVTSGEGPYLLLGAHYDSVPNCPGADDNGSAVAVCLECARLIREHKIPSVMIVFFNREEDGLLGSREFVDDLTNHPDWQIDETHVFEMVGYRDHTPGSQKMPPGIPGFIAPDVGDFLGLVANQQSNAIAEELVKLGATYTPNSPVLALKLYLGMEKMIGDIHRSDHAPFWQAGIPAIMWTDTSEFRNANYHQVTDTPDTLDAQFMAEVAKLALARSIAHGC